MYGGGMRQAGILAACGLVALDSMIDRLADDHRNARRLAEGIADLPGITVDMESVQTNMVFFETSGLAQALADRLAANRVRCLTFSPTRIRLVTHFDVDEDDIRRAIQ